MSSLLIHIPHHTTHHTQDFAVLIKQLTNSNSTIKNLPATKDDPRQRKPGIHPYTLVYTHIDPYTLIYTPIDITVAGRELLWKPVVKVQDGLAKAIAYEICIIL